MNLSNSAWVGSAVISGVGLLLFGAYLFSYWKSRRRRLADGMPQRPWRVLGAAICVLLSVMFFIGVNYLDGRRNPQMFLMFWILMLLLTGWVCVLALMDVMFTRRLYLEGAGARRSPPPTPASANTRKSQED